MKDRILEFLKRENKTSVHFAEEIGVQPSGISHILSGRNNPSLDFVLKMLEKYQFLSSDWLLFGKGQMYKDHKMPTLFDDPEPLPSESQTNTAPGKKTISDLPLSSSPGDTDTLSFKKEENIIGVRKIVWFYNDGSFEEFSPRND